VGEVNRWFDQGSCLLCVCLGLCSFDFFSFWWNKRSRKHMP
jgi:hypothetical protein